MSAEYLYLAFVVLAARSLLGSAERPMGGRRFVFLLLAQLLPLAVMRRSPALGLVIAFLAAVSLAAFVLERGEAVRNLVRFLASLFLLAALSFIGPPEHSAVRFAGWAVRASAAVSQASLLLAWVDRRGLESALAVVSGALFAAAEINNLTRYILLRLKVAPVPAEKGGEMELRRGKLIGIVERLLIFTFVLAASPSAIGFVLAAKAFTRFRELDDRSFAEYVLIGTLLSASGAILVGIATRRLLALL